MLGLDARPILRTCVRTLLAGALMSLPLLYTLQGGIWLRGWILGSAGALAVFGGVLLLTGEVRPADLRAAVARLRGRAAPAA